MAEFRLIFGDNEISIVDELVTIGRSSDNVIAFPDDSNVSRYHAEIERRGSEHCLIDLNSSNGTKVNGVTVNGEVFLEPGDEILLGGTSKVVYELAERSDASPIDESDEVVDMPSVGSSTDSTPPNTAANLPKKPAGAGKLIIIATAVLCIAILFVAVAAGVYFLSGSSCKATAEFISPENRSILDTPTELEIDVKNGSCVAQVIYTVDGKPFASSDQPPFSNRIDPSNFPDLADGQDHAVGIILIDNTGNQIPQPKPIFLGFETRKLIAPVQEPIVVAGPQPPQPAPPTSKEVSVIELNHMAGNLAKQLSGGRPYNVSNPQFLKEVQKRTVEFAQEGYFAKATKYRDVINVAFVREQNLDASLGYLLAMSRSGFDPAKKGNEEGIWRMSAEFVSTNKYNGLCGTETLSDPMQRCAANSAALYMKALVLGVFEGDIIYAVAAFGRSTAEAAEWKSKLPADRSDLWNSIRSTQEREQLVRFFAASIVAENPERFGLKTERPLSTLYKVAM